MERQLILDRLQATIDMLRGLDELEFNYTNWVSKGDLQHVCGTVCCVAGWYPKYFPQVGLKWVLDYEHNMPKVQLEGTTKYDICKDLEAYHGMAQEVVSSLFLGFSLGAFFPNYSLSTIPLRMVIERFKDAYAYVETGELDYYLLLDPVNEDV